MTTKKTAAKTETANPSGASKATLRKKAARKAPKGKTAPEATPKKKTPLRKGSATETATPAPTPKKETAPAPEKKETTPAQEFKWGNPQIRIMKFLATRTAPVTRRECSEGAPCDYHFLTEWVGSANDEIRAKNDVLKMSLIGAGYVVASKVEGERQVCYSITKAGRDALKKMEAGA